MLVSYNITRKIEETYRYITRLREEDLVTRLIEIKPGERAEILDMLSGQETVETGGHHHMGAAKRLESMGLRNGKQVEMLTNQGTGPLLLKVDESRIALGRGIAKKIMVVKVEG